MSNLAVSNTPVNIMPTSLDSVITYAEMIKSSEFVPKNMRGKAGDIVCAITMGASMGLNVFESLNNLAVINGRVTMWGDTLKAKVLMHPDCVDIIEELQNDKTDNVQWTCTIKRRNRSDTVRTFSLNDAKKAGLFKSGNHPSSPWVKYTNRMIMFKARSWALRDAFPDAIRGIITTEEAQDYAPIVQENTAPTSVITQIKYEEPTEKKKPIIPEVKFVNILKALNSGNLKIYDENKEKLEKLYIIPEAKQKAIKQAYQMALSMNQPKPTEGEGLNNE